jgi:hypothetical protein
MACCSEPKSGTKGGGCCGGAQPFPWFSALCDPAMGKLFLLHYWRGLLLGVAAGVLAGAAVLAAGEALGGLGPVLGGPWFHVHAAAILPATLAGGLVLALAGPGRGLKASAWVLGALVLGGLGNGFLETGGTLAAFLEGAWIGPLLFNALGLPALWLALALARTVRPGLKA